MNKKNNWLDAYEVKARLVPAALCAVPTVVLYHYLLQAHFGGLFTDLGHVRLLGYLTIEAAVTYAIMQLNNRLGGKLLQGAIFSGGRMPTTQLLMPGDLALSLQMKRDIAKKFKKDFGKDLPLFDRNMTDSERRQRIGELMAHVRNATRGDLLVKNHNIEYGFVRNLCGGAFVAALICAASAVTFGLFSWDEEALLVSLCLLAIYGLIATASKPLIRYFGTNYAKVLLEQYLCLGK
jgi:hypothetical protein